MLLLWIPRVEATTLECDINRRLRRIRSPPTKQCFISNDNRKFLLLSFYTLLHMCSARFLYKSKGVNEPGDFGSLFYWQLLSLEILDDLIFPAMKGTSAKLIMPPFFGSIQGKVNALKQMYEFLRLLYGDCIYLIQFPISMKFLIYFPKVVTFIIFL